MSINAWAQVAISLLLIVYGPGVVFVKNIRTGCHVIGTGCILCKAPRTNETLPDFHEWCRVTRHPRIFRGLTGCQRTPGKWGVTLLKVLSGPDLLSLTS